MTYVASDGPPSVDAKHEWDPATGTAPPALNAWTADPITFPFIKVEQIQGWRSAPEADDNREPRSYGPGEIAIPGELLGKTIVYELEVQANTRETCLGTVTSLLNGFGDRSGLGTMTVTPFASIGGVVWMYQARVLDFDADPLWTHNPAQTGAWRWAVRLHLRMLDPYFYTPNLAGTGYL